MACRDEGLRERMYREHGGAGAAVEQVEERKVVAGFTQRSEVIFQHPCLFNSSQTRNQMFTQRRILSLFFK